MPSAWFDRRRRRSTRSADALAVVAAEADAFGTGGREEPAQEVRPAAFGG